MGLMFDITPLDLSHFCSTCCDCTEIKNEESVPTYLSRIRYLNLSTPLGYVNLKLFLAKYDEKYSSG